MRSQFNNTYHWIWLQTILVCSLFFMQTMQVATGFEYKPSSNVSSAKHRKGGATRELGGINKSAFKKKTLKQVQVLAPKNVALTNNSQPRLYWYLKPRIRYIQVFQIRLENSSQPLFKKRLPMRFRGGIQSIDLARYGVSLQPNKTYVWQVALQPRRFNRYQTIPTIARSRGQIKFVTTKSRTQTSSKTNSRSYPVATPQQFWYDAFDNASYKIQTGPRQAYWRRQRAILLEQAGLHKMAKIINR
ncbi:hypothetical protein TI05_12370 [Achromatium sp. WMS3]|nr:hypothetical protein TI05_12370 [Achromatium sp. WMS3]